MIMIELWRIWDPHLRKPLRSREDDEDVSDFSDFLQDLEWKRGLQADAVTCGALLGVRKLMANLHTWPLGGHYIL